jgi:hypothetical protein
MKHLTTSQQVAAMLVAAARKYALTERHAERQEQREEKQDE